MKYNKLQKDEITHLVAIGIHSDASQVTKSFANDVILQLTFPATKSDIMPTDLTKCLHKLH